MSALEGNLVSIPPRMPALCPQTDPEIFFPTAGESTRTPKTVCEHCAALCQCRAWVLDWEQQQGRVEHGIWGGLSAMEREHIRRQIAREEARAE